MNVLTIRSVDKLSDEQKNEIHFAFGMEQHTDYVFKDRSASVYSATINIASTDTVIERIVSESIAFSDLRFIIDDLDLESNSIKRLEIRNGQIVKQLSSRLLWEAK
jgi:hypothetical protein